MALTADQEARAMAWASVFQDGAATMLVLDELEEFIGTLRDDQQWAAGRVVVYLLRRRHQLRRQTRKDKTRG